MRWLLFACIPVFALLLGWHTENRFVRRGIAARDACPRRVLFAAPDDAIAGDAEADERRAHRFRSVAREPGVVCGGCLFIAGTDVVASADQHEAGGWAIEPKLFDGFQVFAGMRRIGLVEYHPHALVTAGQRRRRFGDRDRDACQRVLGNVDVEASAGRLLRRGWQAPVVMKDIEDRRALDRLYGERLLRVVEDASVVADEE